MNEKTVKHRRWARAVAVLLSLLLLTASFPAFPAASSDREWEPEEGVYRIRNLSDGMYLGVYKYSARSAVSARVFTSAYDANDTGECFTLKKNGDGCWNIIPKNDSEKYLLCCEKGTESGAWVTKKARNDALCLFDITPVGEYYTIAPSGGDNLRAVLAAGDEVSGADRYTVVADYTVGDATQLWVLEPILTTGISVAYRQTTVKLYSSDTFYAAMQPTGAPAADARWSSSDDSVLLVGQNGRYCALSEGTVTVTVEKDALSASFDVTVADADCFTWYSQNSVSGSDWDASMLTSQFWVSEGIKKRFMWDGAAQPNYDNWMDTGCALCSVACVLHNMGAVMKEGVDFRTGQNGNLAADPYTVALANTVNTKVTDGTKTLYGNPSYVAWKYISDRFFVDGQAMACKKIYTSNRLTIKKLLEEHPQGVIAQMARGANTHYVVLAECLNPEEKTASKIEFRIFDPAAYLPVEGDGVPMKDSISSRAMYYSYYSISAVVIYDVADKVD